MATTAISQQPELAEISPFTDEKGIKDQSETLKIFALSRSWSSSESCERQWK